MHLIIPSVCNTCPSTWRHKSNVFLFLSLLLLIVQTANNITVTVQFRNTTVTWNCRAFVSYLAHAHNSSSQKTVPYTTCQKTDKTIACNDTVVLWSRQIKALFFLTTEKKHFCETYLPVRHEQSWKQLCQVFHITKTSQLLYDSKSIMFSDYKNKIYS